MMSFTRDEIDEIAGARNQIVVHVVMDGKHSWLTVDKKRLNGEMIVEPTLDQVAECLNTDTWLLWEKGRIQFFDNQGNQLKEVDVIKESHQPLYIKQKGEL